jgi:glyoxylate reductase
MGKPKVYCTHALFEEPRHRLAEQFDAEYWTGDGRPPRAEVLQRVAGKDALIPLLTERVDTELLDAAGPNLRIVANVAVGYDNIDLPACTARRVVEGDRLARSGAWRQWNLDQLRGTDVARQSLRLPL